MILNQKKIDIVLNYGTGPDGLGEPRQVKLSGHRVSVSTSLAGGAGMSQAQVRIFGLTLSMMNQLSTVGLLPTAIRRNTITVLAGDDATSMAQVFQGTIQAAWADMTQAPEVSFNITGLGGLIEALMPIAPSSFPGSVDAADVLAGLADQMNLTFENNGVSVILSKPYFPGSARAQAQACADAAKIEWVIDNGVLAIWPRGSVRKGLVALISPTTGMIGYPTYTATGIIVKTLFNPNFRFGAQVQVESSLTPACGTWQAVTLNHDLEANTPGGKWFTQLQLAAIGYVVVA